MNSSWEFDGQREINRKLEWGSSFGLTKDMYGALAHIAMGALRQANVQPAEIKFLPSGAAGCDVVLYGKNCVFTVRMERQKERSTLYALPLDSKLSGPGNERYSHRFTGNDYVGEILAVILRHEGVDVMTLGEYYGTEDPDF
jgi:hypothetical protein